MTTETRMEQPPETPENTPSPQRNEHQKVAGIYARVSKEDRRRGVSEEALKQSIRNQIEICTERAHKEGYQHTKIYEDFAQSGGKEDRKAFQAMYLDAREGHIHAIYIKDLSRFARDYRIQEDYIARYDTLHIPVIPLFDNMEKKPRQIQGLVNEWYRTDLSDKYNTFTLPHLISTKQRLGRPPHGYTMDKNTHTLTINPATAPFIRKLFNDCANGKTLTDIARTNNFTMKQLKRILNNKSYTGHTTVRDTTYPTHKPLITPALYTTVQEHILKEEHEKRTRI